LTAAPDRFRAVEMLVDRSFDAAILFLGTSPRDIWELIPLLGRLDSKLPILTVAEEDSVETQREIRRLRVFYHLTQPVDVAELRQALEEALAHRGAQR
jgi:DNA-binding response OmpR family regulator